MPGMDGLTATEQIRALGDEIRRKVPMIALTAHVGHPGRQKMLDAGMTDFLPKPIDPAQLYAMIEQHADRAELAQPNA
ncbi:MAG: response regulator [Bryobacteraceae bacterium]|nr:response regulator [Bryobacteraceae bacterium]MDW8378614.1 response regulator [Bryobacterales bacterium]